MWFLYLLSWVATAFQICFITLSIAAGLFYLAELVEEYTTMTAKIIKYIIWLNLSLDVCLLIFESLPYSLSCGLLFANMVFLLLLQTFPYIEFTSPPLLFSIVIMVWNHYFAFNYFAETYYPFSEILGFFTILMWLVPFSFFISLSANEYVLPMTTAPQSGGDQDNGGDIVSNYFKKKNTKYGLLSFLKSAQQSILPERIKKVF